MISVVIPTYNRVDLLPQTLEAVLGQSAPAHEVIVVDDGSQDGTEGVVARHAPLVRYLRILNSGELVARNTGLRAATGRVVAFCDSDDVWRPDFLASMGELWRLEPDTKVAYTNFVIIRDGVWQQRTKFDDAPAGYWQGCRRLGPDLLVFDRPIVARLIRFMPFFPSCLAAEREFLLRLGGWDEAVGRTVSCDLATHLLLAEHAPFGVVQKPLVGIRKHAGNYSADVQKMNLGDAWVLEHVLRRRPSLAPHAAEIRSSMARRRAEALEAAFARCDFAGVREIYPLLPGYQRSARVRAKAWVASMPAPLRSAAAKSLLSLGSLASRQRRRKASSERA